MTHQIPSAHTAALSGCMLLVLRLLERLLFGEFLVHPRPLPLRESFRRDGRKIRAQFVALFDSIASKLPWMSEESRRRSYLDLEELFQTNCICLFRILHCLLLRFEHETWREGVPIVAVLAVWTLPEPAVLLGFDRLDEVLADDLGAGMELLDYGTKTVTGLYSHP